MSSIQFEFTDNTVYMYQGIYYMLAGKWPEDQEKFVSLYRTKNDVDVLVVHPHITGEEFVVMAKDVLRIYGRPGYSDTLESYTSQVHLILNTAQVS